MGNPGNGGKRVIHVHSVYILFSRGNSPKDAEEAITVKRDGQTDSKQTDRQANREVDFEGCHVQSCSGFSCSN